MDDKSRIALLERVLVEQWGIYADAFLNSTDKKLQQKAFVAFDRRLRKLGILPPTD